MCPDETTSTGDDAEITTGGGAGTGDDDVMAGSVPATGQVILGVDTGQQTGGRQQHPAGIVGDLQRGGGGSDGGSRSQQYGATRRAVLGGHLGQVFRDDSTQFGLVIDDESKPLDALAQLVTLGLQLDRGELGESTKLHVEDVVGLHLVEVEGCHESGAGRCRVLGGPDDGNDVVDVDDGQQQSLDEVQPVLGLVELEVGAPQRDLEAMVEVDLQHLLQTEGSRLSLDQADGVDREGVLELGELVQPLQQGLRVDAVLDLYHQTGAVGQVGEVLDVGDAGDLLGLHQGLDLVDDALRADHVRQLGDDDAAASRGDLLDAGGGADLEGALAGSVGASDAVKADDPPAGGQIRSRHEAHDLLEISVRVVEHVTQGRNDLDEVVWRNVGGHPHRDARRSVDEQVREGGRQNRRLGLLAVVVGLEVDGVLVEPVNHGQGWGSHPALGVTHGGRAGIQGSEVAVPVDQREAHGPGLGGADEGVVDGGVTVRVELTHDLTDDTGRFHMGAIRADPHVTHGEEDATLNGFEAVTGIGQGTRVDDGVGVLEEAVLHLAGDIDVDDVLGEVVIHRLLGHRDTSLAAHANDLYWSIGAKSACQGRPGESSWLSTLSRSGANWSPSGARTKGADSGVHCTRWRSSITVVVPWASTCWVVESSRMAIARVWPGCSSSNSE